MTKVYQKTTNYYIWLIWQKIYDIMSAKEKEAAAKQTFTFLAPLTNEQSCEAGRKSAKARVRECRVDKE